jgi:hypothetical protein
MKYKNNFNLIGIGDWGLGPIPNPQSPILLLFTLFLIIIIN